LEQPPLLGMNIFPRAISLAFAGAVVSEIAPIVLIQNPDHRGVRILSARDWKGT